MPLLTGGRVIEGSRPHLRNNALAPVNQAGIYTSPGVPANGFLNNIAAPGQLVVNMATGVVYENTGTLAATVWTSRGSLI
jgi:hypothetical protein